MLVSQMDVVAQDLRRQDLLTQTRADRVTLDCSSPSGRRATVRKGVRQAVGTVLIQAGERLQTQTTVAATLADVG